MIRKRISWLNRCWYPFGPKIASANSLSDVRNLSHRLRELEHRREEIERGIAEAAAPQRVELQPNLPEFYRRTVAELERALNDEDIEDEAAELIRALIARVVPTPRTDAPNGLAAELHGALAQILRLGSEGGGSGKPRTTGRKQKLPPAGAGGSLLSVVAGERNHLDLLLSGKAGQPCFSAE